MALRKVVTEIKGHRLPRGGSPCQQAQQGRVRLLSFSLCPLGSSLTRPIQLSPPFCGRHRPRGSADVAKPASRHPAPTPAPPQPEEELR